MNENIVELLNNPNEEYIKNKIIENYSEMNENIIILKYIESKNIVHSDSRTRIYLLNVILTYDYYNNLPHDFFKIINREEVISYHKFIYIIISKIQIPYNHRKFAALILSQFDKKKSINILKEIIYSTANVFDKFLSLTSLKFIMSNENIIIGDKSEIVRRLNNEFSAFSFDNIVFAYGKNNSSDLSEIKNLGKIILNSHCRDLWYENTSKLSTYNSKKYILDKDCKKKYKINEYFCMVAGESENLEELVPYIDESLSNQVLVSVINYFNSKNFIEANVKICDLINKKYLKTKIEILKLLQSKEIKKIVSENILENEIFFLSKSQKNILLKNIENV